MGRKLTHQALEVPLSFPVHLHTHERTHIHTLYTYTTTHSWAFTFPPPHHSLLLRKWEKRVLSHFKSVLQIQHLLLCFSAKCLAAGPSSIRPSVCFRVVCEFSRIFFFFFLSRAAWAGGSKQLGPLQVLCCRSSGSYGCRNLAA